MPKGSARVYIALIFMTLLFGSSFIATKIALQFLHPFQIVAIRYGLAFLGMSFIWRLRKSFSLLKNPDFVRQFILVLVSGPIFYFIFETFSLKYASATEISFMISLIPIATYVLASIVLKEKLHFYGKIALLFSVTGATLLIFGDTNMQVVFSGSFLGKMLALGAVVSSAFYNISVKKATEKVNALELTYLQSAFAFGFYLVLSLVFGNPDFALKAFSHSQVIYALLFLGLGCSFLAIYFMNYGFTHLESTRVALFGNFVPVVTLSLAGILGMGGLNGYQLPGAALILLSLFLSNIKKR
jgi:drug/metabolite transporter (DMT)-like permease